MIKLNKYIYKCLENTLAEHTTGTYFLNLGPLFYILKAISFLFYLVYLEIFYNKELIHGEFSLEVRYAYRTLVAFCPMW